MPREVIQRYILPALVLAVVFQGAIGWAGNLGRCVAARVPSDIVLPDGSTHPAGVLRICHTRDYSPVSGLHETWVGGNAIGFFFSQRGESEGAMPNAEPYIQFRRQPDGRLKLEAYAVPVGDRYETYAMRMIGKVKRPRTAKPDRNLAHARSTESGDAASVVLVAASAGN